MEQAVNKKLISLSDYVRVWFKWVLDPIGAFLNRIGLYPNTVTLLGLAGTTIGAVLLAKGQMTWGGILVLLMGPVDALDGTMARLRGEASEWGAFVDSVTDRYSELVIFCGLLIYYLQQGNTLACLLVYLAAAGSVLVSYIKARADSVKFNADVGILTRFERFLVLAPALVFNQPLVALWIVAILANFTALQRILQVRRQARRQLSQD